MDRKGSKAADNLEFVVESPQFGVSDPDWRRNVQQRRDGVSFQRRKRARPFQSAPVFAPPMTPQSCDDVRPPIRQRPPVTALERRPGSLRWPVMPPRVAG